MTGTKFEHKPTEEQLAVVDATRSRDAGSLMIQAYAGCAKSSTLELAGREVKVPALALAFNKRTADEMKPRFGSSFAVKTLNGLGHGALMRGHAGTSFELDDRKLGKLVSQVARDRGVALAEGQWELVRNWASRMMLAGVVPDSRQGQGRFPGLTPDEPWAWTSIADDLWIGPDDQDLLRDLVREVIELDIDGLRAGVISFDDQIYGSVCLGGKFAQYPVVFVDEAQDLSPMNHAMLGRSLAPGARLIAVGDSRQAIYGFRGADHSSMQSLRDLRASWTDLPLATTFRCPKVVVERQQSHVPGFRAWFTNADGRFDKLGGRGATGASPESDGPVWTWADLESALPAETSSLAMLCRNNAPLLSMAFRLLRSGIGVVMLGRDIGKGLVALSTKLFPDDSTSPSTMLGAITEWADSERSKAVANGDEGKIAGITDRAEGLRAVIDSAGVGNAGALRQALTRLFSRGAGRVTLSSIHKAKGLEWDCVVHLDPWRIPSKSAREAAASGDRRALEQEFNLAYVAETRTRHTLLQANVEDFRS